MNRWERIYTDVNSRYLQQHRGKDGTMGLLLSPHTNSDTLAGIDAYTLFLRSLSLSHTFTV